MRRLFPTIALCLLLVAVAACTSAGAPTWTYPPNAPSAAAPAAGASSEPGPSAAPAAPGAIAGTLEIEAFDLGFTPMDLTVDAPGRYEVKLANTGTVIHDMTFPDGATTGRRRRWRTGTVEVDVPAAGLAFICSIPGHAEAGMKGTITVGRHRRRAATTTAARRPPSDVVADPNAPAHASTTRRRRSACRRARSTTSTWSSTRSTMTVAEGFVQAVWTFSGTVPGPVIRVKVGDTIRVHLKNPAEQQARRTRSTSTPARSPGTTR